MTIRAIKQFAWIALFCFAAPPLQAGAAATIGFLENRVRQDPLDFIAQNRLARSYIQRLRLHGDLRDLQRAETAARASLESLPRSLNPGGLVVRAEVELEAHHFAAALQLARQALELNPRNRSALAIQGDAELELGNYSKAHAIYAKLAETGDSPPILARQARLAELNGEREKALVLLNQAVRGGLWYRIRLGELYFRSGELEQAEAQYQTAFQKSPHSAPVLTHLAELRGAQARFQEAFRLYRKAIARVPRAEYLQALGDLYQFIGDAAPAKAWHARALSAYRQSVADGNAHYLHHLAGFFSDVEENPEKALYWANLDLEMRHSIYAYDTLAWAHYKHGNQDQAREFIGKALILNTEDAHLLYHAGMIFSRAGEFARGQAYLKRCVEINPAYNAFHMHR